MIFEMTEAEKRELLAILFDIMKRFVELGWGLDSVSLMENQNRQEEQNTETESENLESDKINA